MLLQCLYFEYPFQNFASVHPSVCLSVRPLTVVSVCQARDCCVCLSVCLQQEESLTLLKSLPPVLQVKCGKQLVIGTSLLIHNDYIVFNQQVGPQTHTDAHRRTQTHTHAHTRTQTHTDAHRRPQTPTDAHRRPQELV